MFRGDRFRLVRADEPAFPAFYRLVWNDHVAEFSDLDAGDRALCMEAVAAVEAVLRARLRPDKVNLASLGNVVAHLHWHVIARFGWDSHHPSPVWAEARRLVDAQRLAEVRAVLPELETALRIALEGGPGNRTPS